MTMHQGVRDGSTAAARRRALLALVAAALAALACALTAGAAQASRHGTVWLCNPDKPANPCLTSLETTVVQTDGATSVEKAKKAVKAPIDCFYVYPTVSEQKTENANLEIEPQETQVAIDQASRFSQDCKVYAPVYPQITVAALNSGKPVSPQASLRAYIGVVGAFEEYLERFNKGRGFVLIGHSQGALLLKQLIKEFIDPNPALRRQLVSAVLLGGNVLVPEGALVGGDFKNVPACQHADETGCVIAYSSFLKEPPEEAFFGRENSPLLGPGVVNSGKEVVCVNPTLLNQTGEAGPLLPYASTTPFPGALGDFQESPTGSTPWVASPGEYTAQCHHENGASWLQVNPVGTAVDPPEYVKEELGPDWGLHLYDVNIALGNLVKTVAIQAQAYAFDEA
jgi:Protein of unknown function (DUF3089)